MPAYTPTPADHFSFGLWTVGHVGGDPFGSATRPVMAVPEIVQRLGELGVYGVSYHDNDVFAFDATPGERDAAVADFRKALDASGVVVSMATTDLFKHPVFKDGAFTSNDRSIRRFALAKALRNIDLAAELGCPIYDFWGGREGVEVFASKNPVEALKRFREALDFLSEYVLDQGYDMRFVLEPKPNEPRGDLFLPTVGHMLGFIATLAHPEMVGVNPETAHETIAGLSFFLGVSQVVEAGKLFHIDLNDQKSGRFDQDLRFGSEGLKDAFFLVKLLEETGYTGAKHFDARQYRQDSGRSVWDFAAGCMKTYLILAERVRQFAADTDVQAALAAAGTPEILEPTVGTYSASALAELRAETFDTDALANRDWANSALDQLTIETILGAR
jgi:xylose isomerase